LLHIQHRDHLRTLMFNIRWNCFILASPTPRWKFANIDNLWWYQYINKIGLKCQVSMCDAWNNCHVIVVWYQTSTIFGDN